MEVIIATSLILVFLVSLVAAYNLYLRLSLGNVRKVQATFLAEEGIEAVKLIRDSSWNGNIVPLSVDTSYYLAFSGSSWTATTSRQLIDNIFDRTFVLSSVFRDSASDIVESGGSLDPGSRKIVVSVSWFEHGATSTKTVSTYITNLFNN